MEKTSPLPIFCSDCYNLLSLQGFTDPAEDLPLLYYLFHGNHRPGIDLATEARVNRLAKDFELKTDHSRTCSLSLMIQGKES